MQQTLQRTTFLGGSLFAGLVLCMYVAAADIAFDNGLCAGTFQTGTLIPEFCTTSPGELSEREREREREREEYRPLLINA